MRRRIPALPAVVVLVSLAALAGCAPEEEPDPSANEAAAEAFTLEATQRAEDGDGYLGLAGVLLGPEDGADEEGEGNVTLDYPEPVELHAVRAACFGGGSARIGYTVALATGTTSSYDRESIACDGEEAVLEPNRPLTDAVEITVHFVHESGPGSSAVAVLEGVEEPETD